MASGSREMLSVGIDVGTTTTQVVCSRLSIGGASRPGAAPRLRVQGARVLHTGPVHPTPLRSPDEVDAEALGRLLAAEYRAAGMTREDVDTGAVIITGEAARARNAATILDAIAGLAGDFVVTVAGPELEGVIAGRGSGAAAHSRDRYAQVTGVDIGGGTANAAVFRGGRPRSSAALSVGGRQIHIDPRSGVVRAVTPPGARLIARLGLPLTVGQPADIAVLRRFTDAMAEAIADLVDGVDSDLSRTVALTPPLTGAGASSVVLLSGGVGHCYYEGAAAGSIAEIAAYGDVGPLLAASLRAQARLRRRTILEPAATRRATVLGAASETVTLSGSTIWLDPGVLPLRNLPVVRPLPDGHASLAARIAGAARPWSDGAEHVAIALDLPERLSYQGLAVIAEGVAAYAAGLPAGAPLVLVTGHDYAQVLGQTLKAHGVDRPLAVVDQVDLDDGDVLDLSTPVMGGRAVPLSVKTLVFAR